jgi:hypothetical protein
VTATGWTFDALNETSFSDVAELLAYWAEEPPAHVILALRYLGERKAKQPKSEQEAFDQLHQFAQLAEQPALPLPSHLREMAEWGDQQQALLRGKKHGG